MRAALISSLLGLVTGPGIAFALPPSSEYQTLSTEPADILVERFTTFLPPHGSLETANWTRVDETRSIEDSVLPGDDFCQIDYERVAEIVGHGTWWTSWCHDRNTVWPGTFVSVTTFKTTSVTFSAELGLTIPRLGDAVSATVGYSITNSKGIASSIGCWGETSWSGPHGVYWQEKMGWASLKVYERYFKVGGRGCPSVPPRKYIGDIQSNWPDPDNTGFRQFQVGCRDPQTNNGPWCNFFADNLQYTQ